MRDFMLAGVSSNVGKTTVTMGIMAALKARGETVIPFKTGPDYIDPMFHTFVTGRRSTNLDTWMVAPERIRTLYFSHMAEDAVGITEGVMGMYDGFGMDDDTGSSACLSKILGVPVFLVIDGRGMSKSAAALVKGYAQFDPDVRIGGVIINRLSSQRHYELLKGMIETWAGVPCVGWMPNSPEIVLSSRHLGLVPVDELDNIRAQVDLAAKLAEEHVDLDAMLRISQRTMPADVAPDPFEGWAGRYSDLTIGVAHDEAFNFYYEANFEVLRKLGVTLVPFSPLQDQNLPEGLDGLYIGGGFPEVFGQQLQDNAPFRRALKEALEGGLPCFAECGGLMVLTGSLAAKDGQSYAGVGFFDGATTVMTKRLQRFGYVEVAADLRGETLRTRAHEFHHSLVETEKPIPTAYAVSKEDRQWRCGYVRGNTLAGYPHIHFYSNPEFLIRLLDIACAVKADAE
jgi:cobyrinic acid a,c-diamide synthase